MVGRLDGCARNNVDVVFTDYTITDGVHDSSHSSSFALPRDRSFGFDELVSAGSHMVMHTIAYKTDLLNKSAYRQTEGISYTDNEWAVLPMREAKKFVYFPVSVYRYLVGREGQSVSAEQTVRGLWMLEKVLDRLLMECGGLPEDNLFRRYVRFFASHNATLIYRAAFFELPIKQANAKIERWDAILAERMPETYKDLAALSLLNSTPFRFEYVKRWRSAGALRNWPIRIARMIHAVEKFVRHR